MKGPTSGDCLLTALPGAGATSPFLRMDHRFNSLQILNGKYYYTHFTESKTEIRSAAQIIIYLKSNSNVGLPDSRALHFLLYFIASSVFCVVVEFLERH